MLIIKKLKSVILLVLLTAIVFTGAQMPVSAASASDLSWLAAALDEAWLEDVLPVGDEMWPEDALWAETVGVPGIEEFMAGNSLELGDLGKDWNDSYSVYLTPDRITINKDDIGTTLLVDLMLKGEIDYAQIKTEIVYDAKLLEYAGYENLIGWDASIVKPRANAISVNSITGKNPFFGKPCTPEVKIASLKFYIRYEYDENSIDTTLNLESVTVKPPLSLIVRQQQLEFPIPSQYKYIAGGVCGINSGTVSKCAVRGNIAINLIKDNPYDGMGGGFNGARISPEQSSLGPNIIQVFTEQDLANIQNEPSGNYVLMNDIDLALYNGWEWAPIPEFNGTLDGQGYVIKNMSIKNYTKQPANDYNSLFAVVGKDAVIKNVGLEGRSISGLGYAGGICSINYGLISNCYATVDVYGYIAGGICSVNYGTVSKCYSAGEVIAMISGGICGGNLGLVSDCYSAEDTSFGPTGAPTLAGGVCGYSNAGSTVANCVVLSTIAYVENTDLLNGSCYLIGLADNNAERRDNLALSGTSGNAEDDTGDGSGGGRIFEQAWQRSTYESRGWDFDAVWGIDPGINDGLPYLLGIDPRIYTAKKDVDITVSALDFYPGQWMSVELQRQFEATNWDNYHFANSVFECLYSSADPLWLRLHDIPIKKTGLFGYYQRFPIPTPVFAWNLNAANGTAFEETLPGIIEKGVAPAKPVPFGLRLIRNSLSNNDTGLRTATILCQSTDFDEDSFSFTSNSDIPVYFRVEDPKGINEVGDTINANNSQSVSVVIRDTRGIVVPTLGATMKYTNGWWYCNVPIPSKYSVDIKFGTGINAKQGSSNIEQQAAKAFFTGKDTALIKDGGKVGVEVIQATNNAVYLADGWKDAANLPYLEPFFIPYTSGSLNYDKTAIDITTVTPGSLITGEYSISVKGESTPVYFRVQSVKFVAPTNLKFGQVIRAILTATSANSTGLAAASNPTLYSELIVYLKQVDGWWYCNLPLKPGYDWEVQIKHDIYIYSENNGNETQDIELKFANAMDGSNSISAEIIQATNNAVYLADGWKDAAGDINSYDWWHFVDCGDVIWWSEPAAPTANPPSGKIASGTQIALKTTTPDAQIYYTMDGTAPTKDSIHYTQPITISTPAEIKAVAIKRWVDFVDLFNQINEVHSDIAAFYYSGINDATVIAAFDSYGGTDVESQTINRGGKITKPADPTKKYYAFSGWFTAAKGGEKWDFETPLTDGLVLYAQWKLEGDTYKVYLESKATSLNPGDTLLVDVMLDGGLNYTQMEADIAYDTNLLEYVGYQNLIGWAAAVNQAAPNRVSVLSMPSINVIVGAPCFSDRIVTLKFTVKGAIEGDIVGTVVNLASGFACPPAGVWGTTTIPGKDIVNVPTVSKVEASQPSGVAPATFKFYATANDSTTKVMFYCSHPEYGEREIGPRTEWSTSDGNRIFDTYDVNFPVPGVFTISAYPCDAEGGEIRTPGRFEQTEITVMAAPSLDIRLYDVSTFKIVRSINDGKDVEDVPDAIAFVKGQSSINIAMVDTKADDFPNNLRYDWKYKDQNDYTVYKGNAGVISGSSGDIFISAPTTAGRYTLEITFSSDRGNETNLVVNDKPVDKITRTVYVTYDKPIRAQDHAEGVDVFWLDKTLFPSLETVEDALMALNRTVKELKNISFDTLFHSGVLKLEPTYKMAANSKESFSGKCLHVAGLFNGLAGLFGLSLTNSPDCFKYKMVVFDQDFRNNSKVESDAKVDFFGEGKHKSNNSHVWSVYEATPSSKTAYDACTGSAGKGEDGVVAAYLKDISKGVEKEEFVLEITDSNGHIFESNFLLKTSTNVIWKYAYQIKYMENPNEPNYQYCAIGEAKKVIMPTEMDNKPNPNIIGWSEEQNKTVFNKATDYHPLVEERKYIKPLHNTILFPIFSNTNSSRIYFPTVSSGVSHSVSLIQPATATPNNDFLTITYATPPTTPAPSSEYYDFFTIIVAPNNTNELRIGTVTVAGEDFSETIYIIQDGSNEWVDLSDDSAKLDYSGGTEYVSVESNVSWKANTDADWLEIYSPSGIENGYFAITAEECETDELPRTATVTVSGGGVSKTLTVTQMGAPRFIPGAILYQPSPTPATISLYNNEDLPPIATATTTDDGAYTLAVPTPQEGARYKLVITKPGYLSYTINNLNLTEVAEIETIDIRQLAGDVNGDGVVNAVDLTQLLSEFNREPVNFENADIDGNGIVNAADLTYLLAGFNKRDVVIDKNQ